MVRPRRDHLPQGGGGQLGDVQRPGDLVDLGEGVETCAGLPADVMQMGTQVEDFQARGFSQQGLYVPEYRRYLGEGRTTSFQKPDYKLEEGMIIRLLQPLID